MMTKNSLARALLLAGCASGPVLLPRSDLAVCGADQVFILDVRGEPRNVWSWRVRAETRGWAEHLRFLGSDRTGDFPKQKLYKARWIPRQD